MTQTECFNLIHLRIISPQLRETVHPSACHAHREKTSHGRQSQLDSSQERSDRGFGPLCRQRAPNGTYCPGSPLVCLSTVFWRQPVADGEPLTRAGDSSIESPSLMAICNCCGEQTCVGPVASLFYAALVSTSA